MGSHAGAWEPEKNRLIQDGRCMLFCIFTAAIFSQEIEGCYAALSGSRIHGELSGTVKNEIFSSLNENIQDNYC